MLTLGNPVHTNEYVGLATENSAENYLFICILQKIFHLIFLVSSHSNKKTCAYTRMVFKFY